MNRGVFRRQSSESLEGILNRREPAPVAAFETIVENQKRGNRVSGHSPVIGLKFSILQNRHGLTEARHERQPTPRCGPSDHRGAVSSWRSLVPFTISVSFAGGPV
jgi:hypothetical protein